MKFNKLLYLALFGLTFFSPFKKGISQTSLNLSDGNMVISSATNLVIDGDLINSAPGDDAILLSGEIDIKGNFSNNAASGNLLTASTGKVVFNGSSAQAINGSKETYFGNLKINNAAGLVNTSIKTFIEGILELTSGIISTDAGHEIVMQDGSSYTGGSNSSFIDGPMSKVGTTNFTFPVGDVDMIEQIGIANLPSSQTFTAQYFKAAHANSTYSGANIHAVSTVEYWDIHPASGTPSINLILNWNSGTFSGIVDPTKLTGAHYNTNTSTWDEINYISSTGGASSGTITVGPVSSYSNFTFGSTDNITNPLPIQLISFDAFANKNSTVNITWTTANELNNDFFTIEKSMDAKTWSYVGEQKGAGNSNTAIDYTMLDQEPISGTSYYRLKQTDFDAQFTYSEIRAVHINTQSSMDAIMIYPNPATTLIQIENCHEPIQYCLINSLGELIDLGSILQSKTIDISRLASGFYTLKLAKVDGTDIRYEKIIIK